MLGDRLLEPILGNNLLNKYELLRELGKGSFGEVWLAQDKVIFQNYAIKILKPGVTIDTRLQEAQIGHAFYHKNLVHAYQADITDNNEIIIAMDYCPSGSVVSLINSKQFISLKKSIHIIIDVLCGLEYLHRYNCFHNDIKPQNILISQQDYYQLADYGIAGVAPVGSYFVMPPNCYGLHVAPEVRNGYGISKFSDIFQVGLTFYRLLVGIDSLKSKVQSIGGEEYHRLLAEGKLIQMKDFPSYIPHKIRSIILHSINPQYKKRYQSALDMRRALERLSFVGEWSVDNNGEYIGEDCSYWYRYELDDCSIRAFKKNKQSSREICISKYSGNNISSLKEVDKIKDNFMQNVILGKI